MNRPWEIMMNFQKRIRPGAAGSDGKGDKTSQLQISAAAQRMLPSNNILHSRVGKVQNIINESARVIEDSRLPALNNTAVSFCRNCACDSCSSLSILNDTTLNSSILNPLVQNFENFLEVQRQQFMAMLQQVASSLDSSVSGAQTVQQTASTMFSSNTSCNLPAITECDSSGISKSIEAVTDDNRDSGRDQAPRTCVEPSTIPIDEDTHELLMSPEMEVKDEDMDSNVRSETCIKAKVAKSNMQDKRHKELKRRKMNSGDQQQHLCSNLEETTEVIRLKSDSRDQKHHQRDQPDEAFESFESFDDYIDDSFRPVRRSSIMKIKDSFVAVERMGAPDVTMPIAICELPKKTKFKVPSYPEPTKKALAPIKNVPCTRSGRTVKKPHAYWATGSRHVKENSPEAIEGPAPSKKRVGRSVNSRIKSKQNAPRDSKENDLKTALSIEDESCHKHISTQPASSSEIPKYPIVSSTSDETGLVVPSSNAGKRGSRALKDASKNIPAKKRKMERQIMEACSIDSNHEQVTCAESQHFKSKKDTRRGIQNENVVVSSSSSKRTIPSEKVKKNTRQKEATKRKRVISKKQTGEEEDNAVRQVQMGKLSSLSRNLSNSTEPDYECYYGAELSD